MLRKILFIYFIAVILIILILLGYKIYKDKPPVDDGFIKKYFKYYPENKFAKIGESLTLRNIIGDVFILNDTVYTKVEQNGTRVYEGDEIVVDIGSSVECKARTSIIQISDESNFKIEKIKEISLLDDQELKFYLKKGSAKASVWGLFGKNILFKIVTPTAVAGVRGTKLEVTHRNDVTRIFCYDGEVSVTDNFGNSDILKKGFSSEIMLNRQMTKPEPFDIEANRADNDWFNEKIRFEKEKNQDELNNQTELKNAGAMFNEAENIFKEENNYKSEVRENLPIIEKKKKLSEEKKSSTEIKKKDTVEITETKSETIATEAPADSKFQELSLEEYIKTNYKNKYGASWEEKYNQDKSKVLKKEDKEVSKIRKNDTATQLLDETKTKYKIDETKKIKEYAR